MSAVIPAYNGADFLREAIESVYAQTRAPDEILVINDGSTDGTEELLRGMSDLPGFRWLTTDSGGEARTRNLALEVATGELVAFLDQDDRWHSSKLERQLEHFAADPRLAASFTSVHLFGTMDRVVHPGEWDPEPAAIVERLLSGPFIGTCSAVVARREVLRRIGFDEALRPYGCDWLMWLNVAARGGRIAHIPEPLVDYRQHSANTSSCAATVEIGWRVAARFFEQNPHLARGPYWRAHHHLLAAIAAKRNGNRRASRGHIFTAARIHPPSVRPGWLGLI